MRAYTKCQRCRSARPLYMLHSDVYNMLNFLRGRSPIPRSAAILSIYCSVNDRKMPTVISRCYLLYSLSLSLFHSIRVLYYNRKSVLYTFNEKLYKYMTKNRVVYKAFCTFALRSLGFCDKLTKSLIKYVYTCIDHGSLWLYVCV